MLNFVVVLGKSWISLGELSDLTSEDLELTRDRGLFDESWPLESDIAAN